MSMNAPAQIRGNVGRPPEMRHTSQGTPVLGFSVACNERGARQNDGSYAEKDPSWFRVNVWGDYAHDVAAVIGAGSTVLVVGTWNQRKYEHQGANREAIEIKADVVALVIKRGAANQPGGQPGNAATGGRPANQPGAVGSWQEEDGEPF